MTHFAPIFVFNFVTYYALILLQSVFNFVTITYVRQRLPAVATVSRQAYLLCSPNLFPNATIGVLSHSQDGHHIPLIFPLFSAYFWTKLTHKLAFNPP